MSDNWKFVGCGTWVNETLDRSVTLNEDYKRTFRACKGLRYRGHYPGNLFLNKNGNPIKFRSREAAIAYAETH